MKWAWYICFFLISISRINAQASDQEFKPLDPYQFSDGRYTLLFISQNHQDSVDAFYIQSEELLNQIKESWAFKEEAVTYPFSCNDGYDALLLDGKESVAGFSIRYRCRAFIANGEYWHYTPLEDAFISAKSNQAVEERLVYKSIQEARVGLIRERQNEESVYVVPPDWEHYEGYFFFSYPNPNKSGRAPFTPWEDVISKVDEALEKRYPKAQYLSRLVSYGHGSNYKTVTFRVHSTRQFYEEFNRFSKTGSGWYDFEPVLISFRKK